MLKQPVMLMILDGFGIGKKYPGNAVELAQKPNFDRIKEQYPYTTIKASGLSVGLPDGQMGNSEVGHLNIGSGRIVYQELTRITKEIQEGKFFNKKEFLDAIDNAKAHNSAIHLIGLVSDGGVHSHNTHLYALLQLMKRHDFKNVYVHVILDGRDVPPSIGSSQVKELMDMMDEIGVGRIATVSGRYYTMDRDNRWERVVLGYDAMVLGQGQKCQDPIDAIEESYKRGVNDEFVLPTVITENDQPIATLEDNDSVIFFNFRPDRARQITRAIMDEDFNGFIRKKRVKVYYVTLTEYDKTIQNVHVAYTNDPLENTLGEYVSKLGKSQLRIAETEKYAHVTFFFNGGREEPFVNEDRALISSPKVATYDLEPQMSAEGVKEEVLKRIKSDKYDLIVLNFANADMVGHTGVIPAAVKAIETVDSCMGEIVDLMEEIGGKMIITADHGNAERMLDEHTGAVVTAHTTNEVPLIIIGQGQVELREGGILADIAPTLLEMMNLPKPDQMEGNTLIK